MLAKILIIIISIFYSIGVQAIPKPFGLEIGTATLDDVKRMYKIEKEEDQENYDSTVYSFDLSTLPDNNLKNARVWCNNDNIVIKIVLIYSRHQFNNLFSYLSVKYQLSGCPPPDTQSFETDLHATFMDDDYEIFLGAIKNNPYLYVRYNSAIAPAPKIIN